MVAFERDRYPEIRRFDEHADTGSCNPDSDPDSCAYCGTDCSSYRCTYGSPDSGSDGCSCKPDSRTGRDDGRSGRYYDY